MRPKRQRRRRRGHNRSRAKLGPVRSEGGGLSRPGTAQGRAEGRSRPSEAGGGHVGAAQPLMVAGWRHGQELSTNAQAPGKKEVKQWGRKEGIVGAQNEIKIRRTRRPPARNRTDNKKSGDVAALSFPQNCAHLPLEMRLKHYLKLIFRSTFIEISCRQSIRL